MPQVMSQARSAEAKHFGTYDYYHFLLFLGLIASWFLYMIIYYKPPYWDYTLGHYIGHDLANLYVAARLTLMDRIEVLGDPVAYNTWIMQTFGWPHGALFEHFYTYSYPPHFLPVILPFGLLDYTTTLYLWTFLSIAVMAWAGWIITGGRVLLTIMAVLSAGALANLFHANTGAFAGALLILSLWYMRDKPVLAGILFGLLSFKPQLGIVAFVFAVLGRHWKFLFWATATTLFFIVLTWALFGLEPFRVFFDYTIPRQRAFLHYWGFFSYFIISPFEMFTAWGMSFRLAMILHWLIALLVLWSSWKIWHSDLPKGYRLFFAALASIPVPPYINHYDLTILSLGIVALIAERDRKAVPDLVNAHPWLLALLWVAPAFSLIVNLMTPHLLTLLYVFAVFRMAATARLAASA